MGIQLYPYLDDILILYDSPCEVKQSVQKTLQVLTRAGFIVNLNKSDVAPYLGSGVYRGQIPFRPGQTLPTRGMDKPAAGPCQLIQSRGVQTSSPLSEPAGPHGSYTAIGGVHSHSHASHPVVPEVVLEPRNPWVATPDSSYQGSNPSASVVVGQGNALFITQHHHNDYYGCEHGGVGLPSQMPMSALYSAL